MPDRKPAIILEGIAGAVTIGFTALLSPLLRSWYSRWGATDAEARGPFPGDEYVPRPKSEITGAITVHAPTDRVWPWLVQLGCQRGGWYSYDLLDNGGQPSADRIIPEFQRLEIGDVVKAVPNGSFGFPVARIEPGCALTLGGTLNTATGASVLPGDPLPAAYFSGDQTFLVKPIDGKTSRLLFRMRTDWNPTFLNNLIYHGIVEPVSFVMGRKMLRTVKALAEALARQAKVTGELDDYRRSPSQ